MYQSDTEQCMHDRHRSSPQRSIHSLHTLKWMRDVCAGLNTAMRHPKKRSSCYLRQSVCLHTAIEHPKKPSYRYWRVFGVSKW